MKNAFTYIKDLFTSHEPKPNTDWFVFLVLFFILNCIVVGVSVYFFFLVEHQTEGEVSTSDDQRVIDQERLENTLRFIEERREHFDAAQNGTMDEVPHPADPEEVIDEPDDEDEGGENDEDSPGENEEGEE